MKKRISILLSILNLLYAPVLIACDGDCSLFHPASMAEKIYIQQAKVAELSADPHKLGSYLLKVSGNDKTLVFFSDKPDREAGTVTLAQFVKMWQEKLCSKEDQPNAVISYVEFKAVKEDGVGPDILQLSDPKYDAASDTITFSAEPLHEYEVMTGRFENVVIVYDGVNQN